MKRVVVESPYAGNIICNLEYAKMCVLDCLLRGEAPIASHLLFTQPGVLDDNIPEQRKLGIEAGHSWIEVANYVVVYTDFGISKGMEQGMERAKSNIIPVVFRNLPQHLVEELKRQYPD
ncbi:conserved hypothetical protein [Azospirillaceae bacterium]